MTPSRRAPWVARLRYPAVITLAATLVGFVLPRISGITWGAVLTIVVHLPATGVVLVLGAWVGALLAHTLTLTGGLPGLGHRRALTLSLTGSAVANVLPLGGAAGIALNYRMLRGWGYERGQFVAYTVMTNVWDVAAKLALPLVVLPLVIASGSGAVPHAILVLGVSGGVLAAAAGTTIATLSSDRAAGRVGGVLDRTLEAVLGRIGVRWRPHVEPRLIEARRASRDVVVGQWQRLSLGVVLSSAALLLLLDLCLHLTGAGLPLAVVATGFVVERLLTLAGLTPGGAGVVEVGLSGALLALGGPAGPVVAGVLLYRFVTSGLEIPVGGAALVGWWVSRRVHRRSEPAPAAEAHPGLVAVAVSR